MNIPLYLQTVSMLLLALFTFFQWRINKRIAWRVGAQETQSDLQLKLQAIDQNIPLVWWDPTKEAKPSSAKHREKVHINTIYTNVPWHSRENRSLASRAGYTIGRVGLHVRRPRLLQQKVISPFVDFARNVRRGKNSE